MIIDNWQLTIELDTFKHEIDTVENDAFEIDTLEIGHWILMDLKHHTCGSKLDNWYLTIDHWELNSIIEFDTFEIEFWIVFV